MEQQPPERALPPWLVGRTIPTGSRGSAPRAMKVVGMYIVASYPMADRVANEGDPRQMMYSSREMSPDPIAPRAILRPAILLLCTVGLVVLLLSGCAGSQGSDKTGAEASSSSLEKGLVAHWCFDDPRQIGTDCRKGGYDGFVSGTPSSIVVAIDGVVGQAAHFDGATWIDVPSPFFLDGLCQATVTAFFRVDELNHGAQILGGGDLRGGTDPLSFQLYDGRFTNVGFEDIPAGSSIKSDWDDETIRYQQDRWYHLAVTLSQQEDGSHLRVYLDGLLLEDVHETEKQCIGYDISMPTQIGAIHGHQKWQGAIDELRVYHRSLSDTEISLLTAALPR
jgi:hypothetical protein